MSNPAAVAIIPARGGSKRIPGKNVKPFHGKPVISYSIQAARESGLFDRIVVSTDSREIADVAQSFGAEAPFLRPAGISDDHATTSSVLAHALRSLDTRHEFACCIYPAAPLIRAGDLVAGFELLAGSHAATVMPVTPFPAPILRALVVGEDGRLGMMWPEHRSTRSNDLTPAYHDAGQFYWVEVARFLAAGEILGDDIRPIILPRDRVVDIDEPEDWALAELHFEHQARLRAAGDRHRT